MVIGLTLGGISLLRNQWLLQSFKNGSFPSTVYARSKRGGKNGGKITTPTFASYQLVLEILIVGNSFSDLSLQRDIFLGIIGTIHSQGAKNLIVTRSDGMNRQISIKAVEVTGDIDIQSMTSSLLQVTFEAEYPFFQSSSPTYQDVLLNNGGGMAVPMAVPMSMAAGATPNISINNKGNYPAYPIFTFVGPLTNPSITNVNTGETLSLTYSLASSSDSIVVDTYLGTAILKPSGNIARQYVSGDFWMVPTGTSIITLGNANGTDGGKCVIKFYDTYLNI